MSEKKEYDDSLLGDFDDVQDITDKEFAELDNQLENKTQEVIEEISQEVIEEISEEVPQNVEETKELQDLSIEELESLLPDKETEVVEETKEVSGNGGNLNIALHKERESSKTLKTQNELKQQEIELLKQQLELLKVNTEQPATDVETVQVDILEGIEDGDVITKADMLRILEQQKQVKQNNSIEQQKQQNIQQAQQLEIKFNNEKNADFGILSYENVVRLYQTGRVQLDAVQAYGVEHALDVGKNPAEVLYNSIIENIPSLKQKKSEMDIRNMIKQKTASKTNVVEEAPPQEVDEFSRTSAKTDLNGHLNNLCDY
jgi:hypothetical protein